MRTNLLLVGQGRVHELAVEHAGTLGVRRQQPYHEGDLELKVEGEPVWEQGRYRAWGRGDQEGIGFSNVETAGLCTACPTQPRWTGSFLVLREGGQGTAAAFLSLFPLLWGLHQGRPPDHLSPVPRSMLAPQFPALALPPGKRSRLFQLCRGRERKKMHPLVHSLTSKLLTKAKSPNFGWSRPKLGAQGFPHRWQ